MILRVMRRLLPRYIYDYIERKIFVNNLSRKIRNIRESYDYCIVFISTPIHGNLGDQAIVYAQEQFFNDRGLGGEIIEITYQQYKKYIDIIKYFIYDQDLIIIDGGGNMGTLWIEVEHKMQDVVKRFPNNPIFIFPQTVFYSDDDVGKRELIQSIQTYSSHRNLHICAREKASYDFMKMAYQLNNVLLVPDIVLYINNIFSNHIRHGAVLCLRSDREKIIKADVIQRLTKELTDRDLEIRNESTLIYRVVTQKNRANVLRKKWRAFAEARIVITDRLHGMVFAAITGTPCLALDNSSHKVRNVFEWIKDLNYVRFLDVNDENISEHIDYLLSIGKVEFSNEALMPYYDKLYELIDSNLKPYTKYMNEE